MGTLLGDKDRDFFDAVAHEVMVLAGTCAVRYFPLLEDSSPRDPIYGEPIEEIHGKDRVDADLGVEMNGFVTYPEQSPRTGEEGKRVDFDAELDLARVDLERLFPIDTAGAPPGTPCYREPRNGDVVLVQGKFYDVVGWTLDGQLNDTVAVHTIWTLKIKHRTEFDPRRRIEGET